LSTVAHSAKVDASVQTAARSAEGGSPANLLDLGCAPAARLAAGQTERPDEAALSGIGDVCEEMREMAGAARCALSVDALCIDLKWIKD